MKLSETTKSILLNSICLLYILLFVYAAVSKLLEFESFKVQLGQSPLLGAYATFVVWSIPLSEILIAVALSIRRFRRLALFAAYTLMVVFTAYIYIILNYSSFVPCSCGGVLEKMSWNEHLIFNGVFILLALIGVFIEDQKTTNARRITLKVMFFTLLAIISVIVLFLLSENKMHHNNEFTRRIPHSPVKKIQGISLDHNSFYIAGYANGKIYLGNNSAPKYILQIDSTLTNKQAFRIDQDNYSFSFTTAQVRVFGDYYYFADGSIPVIYRGKIKDWKGKPIYNGTTKFTTYEVIDTSKFTVRGANRKTGENYLELIDLNDKTISNIDKDLLKKETDGIFGTDGLLSYNSNLKISIYTYYYRNQYLVASLNLDSIVRGKTIDSLKQVNLKFAFTDKGREKKFATQPEKINTYATTAGNYLFVKSERLGKYDYQQMFKQASVIDVYQLENNSYQFSFYLYHYEGEEIRSFKIYDDIIVGITKNYLVVGRFKKERFNPLE